MKHSITIGATMLAFAAAAASCATVEGGTAGSDKIYLVGVAGGG